MIFNVDLETLAEALASFMTEGGFGAVISIGNFIVYMLARMYNFLFVTPFDQYLSDAVGGLTDLFPSVISDLLSEIFDWLITNTGIPLMDLPAGFGILIVISELCIALAFFKWIMSFVRLFKSI